MESSISLRQALLDMGRVEWSLSKTVVAGTFETQNL